MTAQPPKCLKAFLILLVVAIAPPPVGAQASTPPPPWWPADGPSDPQDFADGWNLRLPLRLDAQGRSYQAGAPVQAHIDLGRAVLDAGWPGSQGLSGTTPRGFTLDPDSVRLVEYGGPQWRGGILGEVAVQVHLGWLDPDQEAYGKSQREAFHPSRNPIATLQWLLPHALTPSPSESAQYYYVYFDILENSDRPAAGLATADAERFGALHWLGSGRTLYGHHAGASSGSTRALVISAGQDDTLVEVRTSFGGQYRRHVPPAGTSNPFTLDAGQVMRYPIGTTPQHVQVVADRPVSAVTWTGSLSGEGEFLPSLDGTLRGTRFLFPVPADRIEIIAPLDGEDRLVSYCVRQLDGSGAVVRGPECTANVLPGEYRPFFVWGQRAPVPTSPASDNSLEVVAQSGSGPFFVQAVPQDRPTYAQVPTVWGAPVGERLIGATTTKQGHHYLAEAWDQPARLRIMYPPSNNGPPSPSGVANVRIAQGEATQIQGPFNIASEAKTVIENRLDRTETQVLLVEALRPGMQPPFAGSLPSTELGRLSARQGVAGSQLVQATPVGGDDARRFSVLGPFALVGFYDDTKASVSLDGGPSQPTTLSASFPREFAGPASMRSIVVADKPIAVLPLPTSPMTSQPMRSLVALPDFLTPTVLPGEYRGYLVDVAPVAGGDPVLLDGRPGTTIEVPLVVRNLARWNGAPLPDRVDLLATASPAGWGGDVTFSQPSIHLANDEPRLVTMMLTLPPTMPAEGVTLRVEASSAENPRMRAGFSAVVSGRQVFDVEAFFGNADDEAGDKSKAVRIQPGRQQDLPFVVRNLGSGPDRFAFVLPQLDGGWSAQVLHQSLQVGVTPELPPGTSDAFVLRIRSPTTEAMAASFIPLNVQSLGSQSAADRLTVNARLSLGEALELDAEVPLQRMAPGQTVVFDAVARNVGRDALSVEFALAAKLPDGWAMGFAGAGNPAQGAIALAPGAAISIPISVKSPDNASAGELLPVLLRAEAVGDGAQANDALGLVCEVLTQHDVRATPPAAVPAMPGSKADLEVAVANLGNGAETLTVAAHRLPAGWAILPVDPVVLDRGERSALQVTVAVPPMALPQNATVALRIESADGTWSLVEATVLVGHLRALHWRDAAPAVLQAGHPYSATLFLENHGNRFQTVDLDVLGPNGWLASVEQDRLGLPAGAVAAIRLDLTAPPDGQPGSAQIRVTASSGAAATVLALETRVTAGIPRLEDVVAPAAAPPPGSFSLLTVNLRNPSPAPVKGLVVRLMADEVALDEVRFASVGPNGTVIAPLRWVSNPELQPNRIEWGLQTSAGYRPLGFEEFVAPPAATGETGIPALAGVWLALALLAAAMKGRRKR